MPSTSKPAPGRAGAARSGAVVAFGAMFVLAVVVWTAQNSIYRAGGEPMVLQPTTRPVRVDVDPATRPAVDEAPATDAAEETGPSFITVDETTHEFPPAQLVLSREGETLKATLFSNDPPEAARPGWSGDSYYFEMELATATQDGDGQITGDMREQTRDPVQDLANAAWVFDSQTSRRTDSPSGIFLGGRRTLQPVNVAVTFKPLGKELVLVRLDGSFAEFRDDTANAREREMPVRQVSVVAVIAADVLKR